MTDILQRYGIKEVADVTFYEIDEQTGEPAAPILVLDSLKVTSIEQTAESTEARGGKGNAKLIVWDFGKEITITIEDALFSPKSLSIMMADGKVKNDANVTVKKSARIVCKNTSTTAPEIVIDGKTVAQTEVKNLKWYKAVTGAAEMTEVLLTETFNKGEVYTAVWDHPVKQASVITITPDSFPGTYYVTGDTMVRSERTGKDEYFQFIIAKAKMQAEQTISLEAEGDPTTFNMSLQVLRPESGEMMQFIKYEFYDEKDYASGDGWVAEDKTETVYYTVKFVNKDEQVIAEYKVLKNSTLTPPTVSEGYEWLTESGAAFEEKPTADVIYFEKSTTPLG